MKSDLNPEEIEQTLYDLIEEGLVETHSVNEDGNFTYRLTKLGKEVGAELIKLGLITKRDKT